MTCFRTGKRIAAVLMLLMLVFTVSCVQADSTAGVPAAESQTVAALLEVPDFKFFVREDGIGKGNCPVYTAPDYKSLRLADGRASCDVEDEIAVAGYVDGWLMVRYEIKDKKVRVGYIPPSRSKALIANISKITFDAVQVQLDGETEITDNPRDNSTPFGTLPAGTDITVLAKYTYTGNWWYVETRLDGKLTRGFIDRSKAAVIADGIVYHGNEELGYPALSPEKAERIGMITVTAPEDYAMIVRRQADRESAMVARVYGGDSFPCYGAETGTNGKVWYRIWVDGTWGWFSSASSTLAEGE